MDNYIYILLLILAFSLSSCGVKKGMMAENQRPETQTLEQRVAFSSVADSARMAKCSGHYSLFMQYDSYGQIIDTKNVDADSLILTPDGRFYKYKRRKKVDDGTYIIRSGKPFQTCMDLNIYDKDGNIIAASEPNGGIVECSLPMGFSDMVIDLQSHNEGIRSFWIRCFSVDGGGQHLIFAKDINTPGCWKVFMNNNVVMWKK